MLSTDLAALGSREAARCVELSGMDDIVLARTLRSQGYDERDLARMRRNGDLVQAHRELRRAVALLDPPSESLVSR
jgi:hypothetical protein